MARGMLKHSNFTKAEQRLILENYFRYDLRGIGGEKFLAIARKKVREHKADLLWFDALQNYLGGNVRDGEKLQAIAPVVSQGRGRGANRGGIRGAIVELADRKRRRSSAALHEDNRVLHAHRTRPCSGVTALASTDQ